MTPTHCMIFAGVLVLAGVVLHSSSAQPLCAGEWDPVTSKLCLTVLEELLRRNHLEAEYAEPPLRSRVNPAELFENGLPFVDRGTKRQDVDHVFLRFGRRR